MDKATHTIAVNTIKKTLASNGIEGDSVTELMEYMSDFEQFTIWKMTTSSTTEERENNA